MPPRAEHVIRDLHHACRSIARMPLLAAVVILSLAVGIGVNTIVFSWIQLRVLRPIPGVSSSGDIHLVEPRTDAGVYPGAAYPEYEDLRERLRSFPDLLAWRTVPLYVGQSGQVERLFGQLVSPNYFAALDLQPALGRFPDAADTRPDSQQLVVVISHGLWQSRYQGAADAIGQPLRVNGRDLTVIGVTPHEFQGTMLGLNFDVWVPAAQAPAVANGSRELSDRRIRGYSLMGRLPSGTNRAQAQSEVDIVMRQLAQAYPDTNAALHAEVLSLRQSPRGPQRMLDQALAILQGLMLLLLLAVCGNTANLMLARASTRQKEMGVRLALGASPWRIASLFLSENVLLALIGAAFGAAIAVWGTQALLTLPLTGFPIRFQTRIDGIGLAFAMSLGALSGLVFGAAPALQLARVDPYSALRAGTKTAAHSRIRNGLMGVQVALALMVLIVAGLFFRSVMETRDTDPGFRRDGVLLAAYDLAGRNTDQAFNRTLAGRLLASVRALPAVDNAAIAAAVPLDIHGLPSRVFTVEGHTRTGEGFDEALFNVVTPGYFDVMGIPIRAGADFAALEDTGTPPQAVVNEEFVRRYAGSGEPLGRRIQARGRTYLIAGVVSDSLYNAFGEPPIPIIYFSYRDVPQPRGEIHIRSRGAITVLVQDVRRIVRDLDPDLPFFNVRTLNEHVETNLIFRRIPARMFAVLGPLLLLLAAIGIYAVVEYTVSLRRTEIGVRLALGASAGRVVARFVGDTMGIIVLGGLAGWLIAFVVAVDFVPGGAVDVPVFSVVPALLLIVAALACWLPARRACRISPVQALRD